MSRVANTVAMILTITAARADNSPFQKPTALELFQLRSMCQKLGEDFEYPGKGASPSETWKAGGKWDNGPEIHYNTQDGHCYLLTSFSSATACANKYLYDAQSKDLVANVEYHSGCQNDKSNFGEMGNIWKDTMWNGKYCSDYDCASEFIKFKMKE